MSPSIYKSSLCNIWLKLMPLLVFHLVQELCSFVCARQPQYKNRNSSIFAGPWVKVCWNVKTVTKRTMRFTGLGKALFNHYRIAKQRTSIWGNFSRDLGKDMNPEFLIVEPAVGGLRWLQKSGEVGYFLIRVVVDKNAASWSSLSLSLYFWN